MEISIGSLKRFYPHLVATAIPITNSLYVNQI